VLVQHFFILNEPVNNHLTCDTFVGHCIITVTVKELKYVVFVDLIHEIRWDVVNVALDRVRVFISH